MTTTSKGITLRPLSLPHPRILTDAWQNLAHKRLTHVFKRAPIVPFDDTSKIVFLSDCHRGDNSRADEFAPNEPLFQHALRHYYRQGFTYVEVGDGDELWKNRHIEGIKQAHRTSFDLLHKFDAQNRLHLILGNHDIQGACCDWVQKDGMLAREGLILEHTTTGQRIFVLHGHQADMKSDRFAPFSRFVIRNLWRNLQLAGFGNTVLWDSNIENLNALECVIFGRLQAAKEIIEQRIITWLQPRRQIVICGHTHRPICASHGTPPYFNTGSCVVPGQITGLEIQNGQIAPIEWTIRSDTGKSTSPIEHRATKAPQKLALLN